MQLEPYRPEPPLHVDEVARAVIGAAIEVHRHLGPGFLESIYAAALVEELRLRQVRFREQLVVDVHYKGQLVGEHRLDLLVEDVLVVELKAVDALSAIHQAQTLSYLKACDLCLGLVINFRVPVLRQGVRRVVRT